MNGFSEGQTVRLNSDNPYMHGQTATIGHFTDYGAVVHTQIGTGQYRALWQEMEPVQQVEGYDREPCDVCGSLSLRRCGTCLVCDSCGSTTGC